MSKRKTPPKRSPGRPRLADGLTEHVQLRMPPALLRAAEADAEASGETLAEWLREAARRRLGWG